MHSPLNKNNKILSQLKIQAKTLDKIKINAQDLSLLMSHRTKEIKVYLGQCKKGNLWIIIFKESTTY